MGLKFLQINAGKRKNAAFLLEVYVKKEDIDVVFIQEPYRNNKGLIKGLPRGELIYNVDAQNRTRSCIWLKTGFQYEPLTQFCTMDLATAKVTVEFGDEKMEVVLCSGYFDRKLDFPHEFKALLEYCKKQKKQIIVGADANSHHEIFGSKSQDKRGEELVELIANHNLYILNNSSTYTPTFVSSRGDEVVDLTLASRYINTKLRNWHISDEESLSDHKYLRFDWPEAEEIVQRFRAPKSTDWNKYREELKEGFQNLNFYVKNVDDIDYLATRIQDIIVSAYHNACPEIIIKSNKDSLWWNSKLGRLKQCTRKKWNDGREDLEARIIHRKMLNEYNKEVRRAKRTNFQKTSSEINDLPSGARLHKLMSKTHTNKLGSLRKNDGNFTENDDETLTELTNAHFPESVPITENDFPFQEVQCSDSQKSEEIFSINKIRWAINSFAPYKSAGADEIFPALLQQGLSIIMFHIKQLFIKSHMWGYIPKTWRKVKVVYIPKPGKLSYDSTSCFRPISMTSFLQKTMEKILDRHIRDSALIEYPLQKKQFGYQEGKSTISALKSLVHRIEDTIEHKELLLSSFIDIEGAFNMIPYQSIEEELTGRNVDIGSVKWIIATLKSRIISIRHGQCVKNFIATRGCSQGGCLSPLMWILASDGFVRLLIEENFHVEGFADDFVISVRGKFGHTIGQRMQRAFKIIENWCTPRRLKINPRKTEVIAFGRIIKQKEKIKQLKLFGEEVPVKIKTSDEVKYLGVMLDGGLYWNAHIDYITSKAIKLIWTCFCMIGKTWGLSPKMILWMYIMLIRPVITYGAVVWWSKTTQKTVQTKLNKVQRLVLLMITRCMKSTPTVALERLLDLPPLHLWIQQEAIQTNYRYFISEKKEINALVDTELMAKVTESDALRFQSSDLMTPKHDFRKNFEVIIPSREEWSNQLIQFKENDVICYTDGSKTNEGTGSGVYIATENCKIHESLSNYTTVFMSEVHAINICVKECLKMNYNQREIHIMSDSQATLRALQKYRVNSRIVWDCLELIYELSRNNYVKLIWVPGHSDIEGNEVADELARQGSSSLYGGPEPTFGIALNTAKGAIFDWLVDESSKYWEQEARILSTHVHAFVPQRSVQRTKELMRMSVVQVRVLVAFLTGHARVLKHLSIMNLSSSDLCRICETEEETAEHILCYCEGLTRRRNNHFGCLNGQLNPTQLFEFKLHTIYDYLKGISIVKKEYNLETREVN